MASEKKENSSGKPENLPVRKIEIEIKKEQEPFSQGDEHESDDLPRSKKQAASVSSSQADQVIDQAEEELHMIEDILSEGLDDVYRSLPAPDRAVFKNKGEEAARGIHRLIHDLKARAKNILGLIYGWLAVIPGVNRFFLEQEAKIKTDKILDYVRKRSG